MIKKLLFCNVIQAFLLTISMAEIGISEQTQTSQKITIDTFPILSWVPTVLTDEHIRMYKNAGFTVLTVGPTEHAYKILKEHWKGNYILSKMGMSYEEMMAYHPDDPCLIGYLIGDEPKYTKIFEYRKIIENFRQKVPSNKIFLVNLLPSHEGETSLGSNYIDYIEACFKAFMFDLPLFIEKF